VTAPDTSALLLEPPPIRRAPPTTGVDEPNDWRWLALAIAVLALLASATSLGNGFAYDDRWIIADNNHIHSFTAPWKFFSETYWPVKNGAALYRPLTITLYSMQWAIGDGSPLVFHVVNVTLYVALSVLVFWFALQIMPRSAAWWASAFFAVHPVHVEAVANCVGQAELWTAVVMIGATAIYVRDRRHGLPLTRQSAWAIFGLYFAGLFIKENAIVLPALLVAAEVLLVTDDRSWLKRFDDMLPVLLWLGLAAAFFLYLRVSLLDDIGGDVSHPSLHHLGMGQRALLMLGLVPEFGRLLLWPAHLYADYSPRAIPTLTSWSVDHIPAVLFVSCVGILVALSWKRAPVVAFGFAWFAIAIAPVANILLPTGILIAERTLFVPSMGIMFAVGFTAPWVIDRLRGRPRLLQIAVAGEMAVLLTLGISKSAERGYTWKDSDTVFRTMASESPSSFKAHYVLGGMFFEQKRPVEGEREWRYAIALMPSYYGVYIDLGHKYREAHVCQAAIPMYKQGLAIEPALPLARVTLVACYLELAQYHRARSEARSAIADGFNRRALTFMIERADSSLAANDSLDATNSWKGHSTVIKP
jgi:hypothetical protein